MWGQASRSVQSSAARRCLRPDDHFPHAVQVLASNREHVRDLVHPAGSVMTPYWDANARGCFIGLSASHRRGHLYRSLLEGIALEQALVTGMIEAATGEEVKEFIAIGGGAGSDLWCQIMADATGKVLRRSATIEASSLGVAICAAVAAGWFADHREAAQAMCDNNLRETIPSFKNHECYAELLQIYRELYPTLRETFAHMAKFTAKP